MAGKSKKKQKQQEKIIRIVVLIVLAVIIGFILLNPGKNKELTHQVNGENGGFVDGVRDFFYTIFEIEPEKTVLTTNLPDAIVQVHMIDVGQGEAILITAPEGNILIDAGETAYGETVVSYLQQNQVEELALLIATHPHSDHIGGMAAVVEAFPVGQVLFPDIPQALIPSSRSFTSLLEAIEEQQVLLSIAQPGMSYDFGKGVELSILGPVEIPDDNTNNLSIISRLDAGEVSFLFTGDAEKWSESLLVDTNPQALSVDVLNLGHHGSNTSTTPEFLEACSPQMVLISCGLDNKYRHPSKEVRERIADLAIYRTDLDGTVMVETDGKQLAVVTEKREAEAVA